MAATAEYLADHPFASPDIVNPPEAPTYRYRPDIETLVDFAAIETADLSAGSRIDIVVNGDLLSYVLQAGEPTGDDLELVPDDYDVTLNQQFWLLVSSGNASFGSISFGDISGTISLEQLPPGSIVTVDSIGEDALYFFTDASSTPSLLGAVDVKSFLDITFTDISGNLTIEQFPPGTVTSLDSIDEDGLYFFDNDTFLPSLISQTDALIFLLPDQTGNDGFVLQTNAGVLSWVEMTGGGGGSIASTSTFLQGDGAGAAVASNLTQTGDDVLIFSHSANNANNFNVSNSNAGTDAYAYVAASADGSSIDIEALSSTSTIYDPSIAQAGDVGVFGTSRMYIATNGAILFSNDQLTTERARINNGLSVGSTTDPGAGNVLLNGLTASSFVKTDASKILVSKTASEMRTDLGLVISTDVQAHDTDLDTIAGLTATTDNFIVSVASAWASRTPTQVKSTLGLTIGTNVQAWDADLDAVAALTTDSFGLALLTKTTAAAVRSYIGAGTSSFSGAFSALSGIPTTLSGYGITDAQPLDSDLTTLAGLTATTDNFIVSVSSAWASRTPSQVRTTLGLVIGTNVQAWDADLDTLAGLTATTNNFIVSVSSAWASRTPAQVKTTLAIANTDVSGLGTLSTQNGTFSGTSSGTNTGDQDLSGYQPLDSDLTTIAGLTATTDNFIVSVSSAWASRTPTQVKSTLGLVIGTNVQAWDADLDTLAGLSATTDNFIVSVSSAWASRTPSQVRTTLGLVIGTNVQAWDADLDSWAGITPGTGVGSALAVNVGTDGAFVVKAGALGTPSGGTLTNCTALPIAGLTASTSTALGVGSIELGAASDTTIARSGAGAITVEGVQVLLSGAALGTPSSGTLSNCTAATDSTAGVMSAADHTTLTALSGQTSGTAPPFVQVGMLVGAYKTGVDIKTNATTDIFTVPTSRTFVVLSSFIIPTSITSGAAVSFSYKIIESGGAASMGPNTAAGSSVAPSLTRSWFEFGTNAGNTPYTVCSAAAKVQVAITTGFTTSTAVTGTVFVQGIYIT